MTIKKFILSLMALCVVLLPSCSKSDEPAGDNDNGGGNEPTLNVESLPNVVKIGNVVLGASYKYIAADNNQTVELQMQVDNKLVTSETTFYSFDTKTKKSTKLESNTFKTGVAGDYVFYASYGSVLTSPTSNPLIVRAMGDIPALPADANPSVYDKFPRHSVLFDFTGARCGYCPNARAAIADFYKTDASKNTEFIAVYSYSSTEPMYTENGQMFANICAVSSYPTLIFDKDSKLFLSGADKDGYYNYLVNNAKNALKTSNSAISAASQVNTASGVISIHSMVKTSSTKVSTLYVCLLEDNVLYPQSNSTSIDISAYGLNTHNSILRALSSEVIAASENSQSYEYCCQFNVSDLIKGNVENSHLLFFTLNDKGIVENAVSCKIGEQVPFNYVVNE